MKLKINKSATEQDLIKRCKKGNAAAQAAIYNLYASKMFAVCKRYVTEENEAEDLMIKGFMRVFSKIEQFKEEGSFEGWIRKIMVNLSLTYLRRNKNMYLEVDIDTVEREPDYHTLNTNLEAQDLLNLVASLPMGYRTVFNLYAIEGYSHKEIGEQLGISESTSKSQLSRARNILQHLLIKAENSLKIKLASYE